MSKITLGQIEIDEQTLQLTSPKTYTLSPKEFLFLKFMLDKVDKPVFIDDILMELWGDTEFFTRRMLDVYITRMRIYATGFTLQKDSTHLKMSPK